MRAAALCSLPSRKTRCQSPLPVFPAPNPACSHYISVSRRTKPSPPKPPPARTKPPFPAGTAKSCPPKPPPNFPNRIPSPRGQAAIQAHRTWRTECPRERHNKKAFYFPLTIYICPFSEYMPFSFCFSWKQYITKRRPCKNICILQAKNFNKAFKKQGFTFATGLCILIERREIAVWEHFYSNRYSGTDSHSVTRKDEVTYVSSMGKGI